jgi:hypothetical protein
MPIDRKTARKYMQEMDLIAVLRVSEQRKEWDARMSVQTTVLTNWAII